MFTLDVGVPVSEDKDDGDGGVVHPPGVYKWGQGIDKHPVGSSTMQKLCVHRRRREPCPCRGVEVRRIEEVPTFCS